ncbi:MAG: NDP-sugar synthase, partial [Promethearchaeota archaeon]
KDQHCVDNYIGDFPTFIEPVHLGKNVKIGDDVMIGPNVYIGDNCEIGDYVELANTILFDHVVLGENFTLENCIIAPNSKLRFNNLKAFASILKGEADSVESAQIFSF